MISTSCDDKNGLKKKAGTLLMETQNKKGSETMCSSIALYLWIKCHMFDLSMTSDTIHTKFGMKSKGAQHDWETHLHKFRSQNNA